jgi:hypothetical protein
MPDGFPTRWPPHDRHVSFEIADGLIATHRECGRIPPRQSQKSAAGSYDTIQQRFVRRHVFDARSPDWIHE